MWDKFWTFIRQERGAFSGMVIGIAFLLSLGLVEGCIKVDSVLDPGTKITMSQHNQEGIDLKGLADKWEMSEADGIDQMERIDAVANIAGDTILGAIAGNFNVANTIGTLIATSGAGSLADTYRKRKKIKVLLKEQESSA